MRNLYRRVAALEARHKPSFPQRIVVHYEGEPEPKDIDDNTLVVHVEYVTVPLPYAVPEKAL